MLYTLFTYDCTPTCPSNHIITFVGETTVVGLISNEDEAASRQEVDQLIVWCKDIDLLLNASETRRWSLT